MKVTLKDLKNNGGKRKEYKFLTPAVELLEKEYKEILPEFTFENYAEALNEIIKEHKLIAYYDSPEMIRVANTSCNKFGSYRFDKKNFEEDIKLENVKVRIENATRVLEDILVNKNTIYYGDTSWILLTELFIVTDEKAFEEFAIECVIKREEKEIENLRKSYERERKDLKETSRIIEKYGEKAAKRREYVDLLEAIKTKNEKEQFEALLKFSEVLKEEAAEEFDNGGW